MSRGKPPTPPGTHGTINYQTQPNGNIKARTRLRLYTGQTVHVTATGKTKTAAARALETRCVERLGTPYADTITPNTPLADLLTTWLDQHKVTPRSTRIYKTNIDAHIKPGIGSLRLNELSPVVLQAYITGLTPGTAKTSAAILSSALKYAVRVGGIAHTPWQAIQLPTSDTKPITNITKKQQDAYIKAVERWCTGLDPDQADTDKPRGRNRGHGLPQVMRLIAGSGIRPGEALALRITDVDPKNRRITISGQVDGKGGRTEQVKNRSSQFARRTITITTDAANAVTEQLRDEATRRYGEPLFPTWKGTYRTVNNLNRDLRAATKGLKFGVTITPKAFRSTIASRIAAKYGHDAAQRQLGHSTSDVTERYYTAPPPLIEDYLGDLENDTD